MSNPGYIRSVAVFLLVCGFVSAGLAQPARTHTVEAGETLYRIASNYDVSVDELRRANNLQDNTLQVGQELVIPGGEAEEQEQEEQPQTQERKQQDTEQQPQSTGEGDHRVEAGETLYSIAARYDITVDSLLAVNQDLNVSGPLREGLQLMLPKQFQTVEYTVRSGNTLGSIARKYGVSVNAIRRVNNIRGDQIRVGQVLTIPSRAVPEPDPHGSLGSVDTTGVVHTYPNTFAGRLTASGEPYNPESLTASHPSLPFGSVLLLTHPETGHSTFVRINDRGPVEPGVLIDISRAAAQVLGHLDASDSLLDIRRVK